MVGNEGGQEEFTGTLSVMDATGDTKTRWNKSDPASVERARLAFDTATANATRIAFRTAPNPEKIKSFDPNAEEIVTVQQYVGG